MIFEMQRQLFNILFSLLLICNVAKAQTKIEIDYTIRKDTTLLLANYFDDKLLVADSLRFNSEGKAICVKTLKPGLYSVVDSNRRFDFLVGNNQQLNITIANNKLTVANNTESEAFQTYLNYLQQQQQKKSALVKQLKAASVKEKKQFRTNIDVLDGEIHKYWDQLKRDFPQSMLSAFIDLSRELKVPAPNPSVSDSVNWINKYHFLTHNFWNEINFSDQNILYTPLLRKKLDLYFNNIILQSPDSMKREAIRVLDKCKDSEATFPYISNYLMNSTLNSKYMGMESAFVAIAERYFIGQKTWADSATMQRIKRQVYLNKPNLLGKQAPDLRLVTPEGEYRRLYDVKAKYTVLVFWETDCGHCKKELPALKQLVWDKYSDRGVKIFAIYTMDQKEEWENYIFDNQLHEWINVYDQQRESPFRQLYNIYSTPTIYLLDSQKKIVAKRVSAENLSRILERKL